MINKILSKLKNEFLNRIDKIKYSHFKRKYNIKVPIDELNTIFDGRNEIHKYMHHFFMHLSPPFLRDHRKYFQKKKRGFGEDAFHSMWLMIFEKYRPKNALEIGVYRGQVITLWSVISRSMGIQCEIHGLSPFSAAGDEVSKYVNNLDYLSDVIDNSKVFNVESINLKKAYSTEIDGIDYIHSKKWDLIYIDVNHDYQIALSDYINCKDSLSDGGVLVIDDSSLYTDFKPPRFSFSGHPGPSKIVRDFAMNDMKFICGVGHNNVFQKI